MGTPIRLDETRDWEDDGTAILRPADEAFFKVIGMNIAPTGQREVRSWDQPMIQEKGPGAVVLIVNKRGEFLLQAKAEPGNDSPGCVLLAPTLQASLSNLQQAHGGKKPPRSELITEDTRWIKLLQDGGRFFHKTNHYAVLRVEGKKTVGQLLPDERWFTRRELMEAIRNGCANEHLLQAWAVCSATSSI